MKKNNKVVLTMSREEADHLIDLLREDLENCEDIGHMQTFIPLFDSLEEQLEKDEK